MQLIMMLLIAVSILTILSGISVIAGSSKKERSPAIWFLLIAVGATIWSISVGAFLNLSPGNDEIAWRLVQSIFVSSILTMVALVGNTSWHSRLGKILTLVLTGIGVILTVLVLAMPTLVFTSIALNTSSNTVFFEIAPCSIAYGTLIFSAAIIAFISLFSKIKSTRKKNVRNGNIVYLIGLAITIVCSLICDLILPMTGNCSLMWVGPITVSTTMLGYYYAILRYRLLILSSRWLKILNYIILMASCAIIYCLIFFLIFVALFRVASPSPAVILLNFIMIIIVLLLMPLVNEVSAFVKSLASPQNVDIVYIIKKLNTLASQKVNLRELADFLAEHLHFSFIGFLVNGHLYGSRSLSLSAEEIIQLGSLKTNQNAIWQDFNEPVSRIASAHDISAIASLKDANGTVFGQIVVGKSLGKAHFDRKDLIQFEMIINLVAAIVESNKHTLKK